MSQRYKILIVDNEVEVIKLFREELQEAGGYDVDLAFDGADAQNRIQKVIYDVVLLDMVMPRVSGKDVLVFIKETSPSTQVIIISGYADLKMAVEATKLGAYDVLPKPYNIDQLENTIKRALER